MELNNTANETRKYTRNRRQAVSAEAVTKERLENWCPPYHPKSNEDRCRLLASIHRLHVLFDHLSDQDQGKVIDAMFLVKVPRGEVIIRQGDVGDNFYIVDNGSFDIFVARVTDDNPNPMPVKVMTATKGMSFGELALMYNSPRAATVIACEDSECWALDRATFQLMLVTTENTKKKTYEDFLAKIEIFKGLNRYEICQLSDMLQLQTFRPGECIIRQGEVGNRFYILESGEAECTLIEGDDEVVVCNYTRGGYFGELALLGHGIRMASVYAVGKAQALWIDKSMFDRVLGPIVNILRKNADMYPTYRDMISAGVLTSARRLSMTPRNFDGMTTIPSETEGDTNRSF